MINQRRITKATNFKVDYINNMQYYFTGISDAKWFD